MKSFQAWISDMAGSIEDASTIVKDEHGEIVHPAASQTFAQKYEDTYGQLTQGELEEAWTHRYEDYDESYFD